MSYIKELNEVNVMRTELKRRCMIFQYDAKMEVAKFFDIINPNRMEQLGYEEWAIIRNEFSGLMSLAEDNYRKSKEYSPKVSMGYIWRTYCNSKDYDKVKKLILRILKKYE